MSPRPCVAMKLIASGVANGVTSWRTLMRAIVAPSPGDEPLDVLRQDVDLEVDLGARAEAGERRRGERVRDERDLDALVVERGDRQRDALDGDRALGDAVAEELGRDVEAEA